MKKIMRKIGYALTWPFAKLFRLAVYLDNLEIGTIFAGVVFVLYMLCMGIVIIQGDFSWGFALLFFILMSITAGIGNWALDRLMDMLIIILQPVDHFNRKCSMGFVPGERRKERSMKPKYSRDGNKLDEFIRKASKTKCYQMEVIKSTTR